MAALIGTAIERNTAISSRNDSDHDAPMTHSSRCAEPGGGVDAGGGDARRRRPWAGVPATPAGMTSLRRWWTSDSVSALCGDESRDDDDQRRCRRPWLVCGAGTAATPGGGLHGRPATFGGDAGGRPAGRSTAMTSGPLAPGPKPSESRS